MFADLVRFAEFELDVRAYELRRSGEAMKLERIPMELLLLLVERQGQLVTREQIKEKLWGAEVFVDTDNAINTAIRKVRRILRDDPEEPRFVQTVVGRGYRFVAPVEGIAPPAPAAVIPAFGPMADQNRNPSRLPPLSQGPRAWLKRKQMLGVILVGLSLLLGTTYLITRLLRQEKIMLAVLPFQNLSGDPAQDYFSDGLTEETITDLGKVSPEKLGVIARTSAMAYKGSNKTARQIGQELGVDYILEGSARREGERIRVSAQLIRVKDQTHISAQNYDAELHDVLTVQSELGEAIAQQVQLNLSPEDKRELAKKRPVDPEAYDLYLRGRYYWNNNHTPQDFDRASAFFQKSIEKDPSYAPAYAGLADCYASLAIAVDIAPSKSFPQAEDAARKAVALDDSLADGHVALLRINFWHGWNWPEFKNEAYRSLALNPNSPDAHLVYAQYLSNVGRHKEALDEVRQAKKLDPLSPLINALEGQFMYYAGQYDSSIKQLRETTELFPDFWIGHLNLGKVYEQKGMYVEAISEFQKAFDLSGNNEALSLAGHAYALSGKRQEALRNVDLLQMRDRQQYVPPYDIALIYAGLGDRKQALSWLEKGFEVRDAHMVFLRVDPKWDSLREEPRFQSLIRRIGPTD